MVTPSENQIYRGVGRWRPALLFVLLPIVVGAALLGLLNAPAQAQTPSPTFDVSQVTPPLAPPVASFGSGSYEQNCAPCHGLTGQGDGPTSPNLPSPATAFADPSAVWPLSPAEMFHTTKFGRIEKLMPPWQNQLSDDEIWQTVAYAWSLHTDAAFVGGGEQLYAQECAACHGEGGAGDGPDAQGPDAQVDPPNFSDPTYAMVKSQEDWLAGWLEAHPEIGQDWTEQEQQQTLEYIRTFSMIPAWDSGYRPGAGVLRGTVVMGTAGAALPPGLEVTLDVYAHFTLAETFTATVNAEGAFEFTGLSVEPTFSYLPSVLVGEIRYSSSIVSLTSAESEGQTTITIYETTSEPAEIRINRTDWIIDDQPGALLVVQLYFFGSGGDRTYTGSPVEGLDVPATVAIHIPAEAQEVTFENSNAGERFQQVGDLYYDTSPLLPGEGVKQIVVRYFLPYEGTSATYAQRFLFPVDQTNLLLAELPQLEVTITPADGAPLEVAESQEFQGRTYRIYRSESLPASEVEVALAGLLDVNAVDPREGAVAAGASTSQSTGSSGEPFSPWMAWSVGGLGALVLAGGVLWSWRSGRVQVGDQEQDLRREVDELARRIAQLDDLHALGQVSDEIWQHQRSQLKARLLEISLRLQGDPVE